MTRAEIFAAVRALVNEVSTDSGALLSDTGNLLELVNDATEQVVLDLVGYYPSELLGYEDVNIIAGTSLYTLTKTFWQILKIEKRITGENPTELEIVDPLSAQYYTQVGETASRPWGAWIQGTSLTLTQIPEESLTGYLRVYGIIPEATSMGTSGPAYLPRETHRLIVYHAAALVAIILGVNPAQYHLLYMQRLERVRAMQKDKFQSSPRFVRESVIERAARDTRDPALYDTEWP